ncbi:MAG: hypothetical protein R3F34_09125 [Planctomycetota bacterium]
MDRTVPPVARRGRTAAILAVAIALLALVALLFLLDRPGPSDAAESATDRGAPETGAEETADVDLAESAGPTADATTAAKESEAARTSVTEAGGARRWSDVLAPFDALDASRVADARIRHVAANGERRTLALGDAIGPNDLLEGCVGVIDSPHHLTRMFVPAELADVAAPRPVALHPVATLRLVASGSWSVLPEGVTFQTFYPSFDDDVEPLDAHLGDGAPIDFDARRAFENVAAFGDELVDDAKDEKWRRRQVRWLLRTEAAEKLFDLDLPPTIGARCSREVDGGDLPAVDLERVPAAVPILVQSSVPSEMGTKVALVDPTGASDDTHGFGVTLAPDEVRVVEVVAAESCALSGRFTSNSSDRAFHTRRWMEDQGSWRGRNARDLESSEEFELTSLDPGHYVATATWSEDGEARGTTFEFDLAPGESRDLGTLAVAPDAPSVTLVPKLLFDGEPWPTDEPIRFAVSVQPASDSGAADPFGRHYVRTDLEPFVVAGLEPGRHFANVGPVAFEGEVAERLRWKQTSRPPSFEPSASAPAVELPIDVEPSAPCVVTIEVPALDGNYAHELSGLAIDRATETCSRFKFDGAVYARKEPWESRAEFTLPPGDYDLVVVVDTFVYDGDATERPSWVGRASVTVTSGGTAETAVPLERAATCRASAEALTGDPSRDFVSVHPVDLPDGASILWFTADSSGGGSLELRGLFPNTEYAVSRGDVHFTTGAGGTVTEL